MTKTTFTTPAGSTYVRSAEDVPLRPADHRDTSPLASSDVTMSGNDVLLRGTYLVGSPESPAVRVTLDPAAVSRKMAINQLNAELSGTLDAQADTSGNVPG